MDKDSAIKVDNVSKTFKIPHEKVSSLRGVFVSKLKGTSTSYETFKALDGVSFEVKKGEFFGIIGRNGSGKSTLLKVLAGIYRPNHGKIHIDGLIAPFLELGIGFNPELSGRDNVYLNATVLGLTEKEIDEKFDKIVAFSELERFIDQKLKNYSSGMQVRLAFSVSIHANRDILLMDEVLAVGDSNFQSKCLDEFAKYRELGRTVILVTHDIGVVQRYCDRAMLLRSGKVEMIGEPQEVGNLYIEQNMSDEERRMAAEEKARMKEAAKTEKRRIHEEKVRQKEEEERQRHLSKKQKEEEERIRQRELREAAEKERNRSVNITQVEFQNENGEVKNIFQTGEQITVVVSNDIRKELENPIFGIVVREAFSKVPVFVTNTRFLKVKTGIVSVGTRKVSYVIENFFGTGKYTVSPAVADKNGATFYDWNDDMASMKIVNTKFDSSGVADFPHSIKF